jgi:hypothetical protein
MEIISSMLASLIILGCSTFIEQDDLGVKKTSIRSTAMSITSDKNLHGYVEQLAEQLSLTSNVIEINKPIAVDTFLPLVNISSKDSATSNAFGQ